MMKPRHAALPRTSIAFRLSSFSPLWLSTNLPPANLDSLAIRQFLPNVTFSAKIQEEDCALNLAIPIAISFLRVLISLTAAPAPAPAPAPAHSTDFSHSTAPAHSTDFAHSTALRLRLRLKLFATQPAFV